MKKIIFIFLFIIIISGCVVVYSLDNGDKLEIQEEIFPLRDDQGKFLGLSCVITIPENFEDEKVVLHPDIFGGINEYKEMELGDNKINLKIINKSKYNYISDSFSVSTKKIIDDFNYEDTGGIGFDGLVIYDLFKPYRVINTALESLFQEENKEINDWNIELKLKDKGYKNINELDKYYLDFYNDKYNLSCGKLSEFDSSIIKEIFVGDNTIYFESDKDIIELAYYYFYNYVMTFSVDLEDCSIGRCVIDNKIFSKKYKIEKWKPREITDLKLSINDRYMTDAYRNYQYVGDFLITLNRSLE